MKKNSKQLSFSHKSFQKPEDSFGGSLLTSNPKTKRPLDSKFPTHLVMRSNYGGMRLPKAYGEIHKLIYDTAKKYGIKVYKYSNVGNHLHLLIRITNIYLWSAFIREFSSKVAYLMRKKGQKASKLSIKTKIQGEDEANREDGALKSASSQKFWKHRPFTRIIRSWKKAFQTMKEYIALNQSEAEGHISRKEIKNLKEYRLLFADG